jgi:hypothetical protein
MPLDQSIIQSGSLPSLSAQDFENQTTGIAAQRLKLQAAQTEEQQRNVALQQAQEQAQAQKDLDETLQKYTTQQPDGSYKIDFNGVTGDLTQRGHGKAANAALGMDSSYINNAFLSKQNDLKLLEQRLHLASSVAYAIPKVDPTATDPGMIAAQKDAFTRGVVGALPTFVQLGVLDPTMAAHLNQELATKGYSPDAQELVNRFAMQAEDASKQAQMHHEQMEDARLALTTPADVRAKDAETADRVQKNAKEEHDAAIQDLSGVDLNDQATVDAFKAAHPTFNLPTNQQGIQRLIRTKVPIEKQPEYDIANRNATTMAALTPEEWDKRVDAVAPPDSRPALNARTKTLVKDAVSRGDFKTADAAIKDASDQQGRTETAVETAKNTLPVKIEIARELADARNDAAVSGLTDDDLRREGEKFAITQIMPAIGNGSVAIKKAIIHYSNEFARQSGLTPRDLAVMGLAYKGDAASLKALQTQRDQIVTFEDTARKNLDLFLDAASKIPDTGVPWINSPLRTLDEKAVGSANMAAVNAARQVANNEIAKVTSGGGLSGVLSDAARKEVANYNPADATFKQTKAVADILRKDMANRHASLDAGLSAIKDRIGTTGAATTAPATTVTGGPPKISSKAEFDALPSKAIYINAKDNKQYQKP